MAISADDLKKSPQRSNADLGQITAEQSQPEDQDGQDAQQFHPPESEADDDVFDFGKAKMEFFKQRARQILIDSHMDPGHPEDLEDEYLYEGKALSLKICYQ